MICSNCKQHIDNVGRCACVDDVPSWVVGSELLALLLFVSVLVAVPFARLYLAPSWKLARAEQLVKDKEHEFLAAFHRRVATTPDWKIFGWQSETVPPWHLVTYMYSDNPKENRRKAYLWCVNLETSHVSRLKSLSEFIDDYLLAPTNNAPPAQ